MHKEQDVVEADAAQTESESDVVSDNTDNVSENVSEKRKYRKIRKCNTGTTRK